MFRSSSVVRLLPAFVVAAWTFHLTTAGAYTYQSRAHAKSGQATLIKLSFDCRYHSPSGGRGAFVEHGTVTAKSVVLNQCGNANEPGYEIWYTSTPGFKGIDHVTIPFSRSGKILIEVTLE